MSIEETKFKDCEDKKGHLIFVTTPTKEGEIWQEYSVGYCLRCHCTLLERTLDNVHYVVWIDPSNQKILKVINTNLYFNEERQRMELLREVQ